VISFESFTILNAVYMFILGACLGSFGNVVIYRLPEKLSVVKPRSRCPKCKKMIRWYDNIPIASWIVLRGKCRNCRTPITVRYPVVESISGLLLAFLYLKYGYSVTFAETAIFAWAGLVASVIDLDHRILPDVITLPGMLVGIVGAMVNPDRTVVDALVGLVAGGGFLWAVAYIYLAIKNEEGMGGGDIKLLGWIGAVLGWRAVIFSILVSSVSGSLVGLSYAAIRKSGLKTAIPFGPFLYFAAMLYIFIGPPLMKAYLKFFFPFS
jgi:leader peptidase (prepilin peptidase) / N-methyltransferase